MRDAVTRRLKQGLQRYGFDIVRIDDTVTPELDDEFPVDFDDVSKEVYRKVEPFTMTGPEKVFALRQAICHVVKHDIPGAIVEGIAGAWIC